MLFPSPKKRDIKAGSFGKCGKMYIKPFSIPDEDKEKTRTAFMRFVKIDICGCWEWQGRIHNGYASASINGYSKWAHRISYALFNGAIKEQMHIDHTCRNRTCVNPAHLRQVTPVENYLAIGRRRLRDEKKLKEEKGQLTLW